jgi:hypothetical protein
VSRPRPLNFRKEEERIVSMIDARRAGQTLTEDGHSRTRPQVSGFRLFEIANFRIIRNLALMELFDAWPIVRG